MNRSKLCTSVVPMLALSVLIGLSQVNAHAQQAEGQPTSDAAAAQVAQVAANLRLLTTTIRTDNNALALGPALVAAFAPTVVTCPATAHHCTIRVIVSSQLWGIDPGTVARMNVTIAGLGAAVDPASLVNVDSTSTGNLANVRTFQWMKRNIPAGAAETVRIQFQVNAGAAFAGFRTATVELYQN